MSFPEFLDAISVAARGSEFRHTDDVADLRECAPGKMLQVDDLSRGFRYGTQQHRNLSCVEQPLAVIIGGGEKWVIIKRIRCPSTPAPRNIHRCSARNRQEPGPRVSDHCEPGALLRNANEYILDDIGGVFLRSRSARERDRRGSAPRRHRAHREQQGDRQRGRRRDRASPRRHGGGPFHSRARWAADSSVTASTILETLQPHLFVTSLP